MPKELILPSGKKAILRDGIGNDLLQAQMKAKKSEEIPYALIAELATIEDKTYVYEDILLMDLPDVIALQTEISGKFQSAKEKTSDKEAPNQETQNKETQEETPLIEIAAALNSPIASA